MKDILSIFESIAVIFAALFTISGILFWKRQVIEKRKIEIAEKILIAFYRARDTIEFSRQKMLFVGEYELVKTKYRHCQIHSDENAIKCMVVIERLNREDEIFSELQSLYYAYTVVLGGSPKTYENFNALRSRITDAALRVGKLWRDADEKKVTPELEAKIKHYESIIWSTEKPDDAIYSELKAITSEAEEVCSKHIAIKISSVPEDIGFIANRLRLKIIGK